MAAQQVSGILEIHGNPAGTIYFDQGQITFARASAIPDLSARLLGALRPSAESRDLLIDGDRPDRDICTMLVQQNDLTRADLQKILRSVVVDALIVLTMPMEEDSFVSDIRFAPSGAHWASAFSRLGVDSVRTEATRRAERMARHHLTRTMPVQLRDLSRPSAILSRQQWAVACTIGGGLSAQDLAWQCGLALYEAIEYVGDLIQAGICATAAAEPSAQPGQLAHWFGTAAADPAPLAPSIQALSIQAAPIQAAPAQAAPAQAAPAQAPLSSPPPPPVIPGPPAPRAGERGPIPVARSAGGHPEPLPQRIPGARIARAQRDTDAEFRTAGAEMPRGSEFTAAPELLHRVLDGLRRIS